MATLVSLTLDCLDLLFGQAKFTRPSSDRLDTAVIGSADALWRFDRAGAQFWEFDDYAEFFDGTGTAGEIVQLVDDHDTAGVDVTVERAQRRTSAKDDTDITTATFTDAGDLWTTAAAHGLSVGDAAT